MHTLEFMHVKGLEAVALGIDAVDPCRVQLRVMYPLLEDEVSTGVLEPNLVPRLDDILAKFKVVVTGDALIVAEWHGLNLGLVALVQR